MTAKRVIELMTDVTEFSYTHSDIAKPLLTYDRTTNIITCGVRSYKATPEKLDKYFGNVDATYMVLSSRNVLHMAGGTENCGI